MNWISADASFETTTSWSPQDEVFRNAINEIPHPEEARSAISKDARFFMQPPDANSFTSSQDEALPLMALRKTLSWATVGDVKRAAMVCGL